MPTNGWIGMSMGLPPDGDLVMTRIDDGNGIRNEQAMRRRGNLFFVSDDSMYVYYAPTHWRSLTFEEQTRLNAETKARIDSKIAALVRQRNNM